MSSTKQYLSWRTTAAVLVIAVLPASDAAAAPASVDMNSGGAAAFAFTQTTQAGRARLATVTRAADGSLSDPQHLSYVDSAFVPDTPPVVLADSGKATYAWLRGGDVQYRTRAAGGALSPVANAFTANSNTDAQGVRLGVDDNGRVTIAWQKITQTSGGVERCQIQTARLATNGALGAVRDVAGVMSASSCICPNFPACTGSFNTAVNGAGEAVFTWTRDGSILTRVLSASGTFSATRTVAATPSVPANHLTAISPNGSINYTWLDTSFDPTLTHVLRTRQRSAAGAFGARKTVVTVDTGGNPQAPQFDVDAADGASTIVYTRPNGGEFDSPVTVATRVLTGTTLGPATTLSAPSASYPNASGPTVSVDAAGGVTLAWVRGSGTFLGDSKLEARTRPSATGTLSATRSVAGNGNDSIEGFHLDRVAAASIFAFSGFISDPSGAVSGQFARVLQPNGAFTATQNYAPSFSG